MKPSKWRQIRVVRRSFARYSKVIVRPLRIPWRWLVGSIRSVKSATTTVLSVIRRTSQTRPRRRWIHLLLGLPATSVMIVAITLTARSIAGQRGLGPRYLNQGMRAITNGDLQGGQIQLTRALELGGIDSRDANFALAVVWQKLGHAGRSMQAFQKLAPVNQRGYPKAHRHLAIMIAMQNIEAPSNEELDRWLWHLTNARAVATPELHESWGKYYLAVSDLKAAIESFRKAATKYPHLYLAVANLHERLGETELRSDALRRSETHFRDQLKKQPNDRNSRTSFATTLLQLGELVEAERVLRTGIRLDPDGPYKMLLAATFVQLHDKLMERGSEFHSEALQQLRNAFEFDPEFKPALSRLLGFAQVQKEAIPELRNMLNSVLASGRGTAIAHLALSNLAWLENDHDIASFHLEQAMSLDIKMPAIANNLAWLLAHNDPPNLDRALKIADTVVNDFPDNPRYLDTRGTVLVKMGRHREGLVDLEKALPGMPDQKPVHLRIASVYRELGMEDVAKKHEQLANKGTTPR